jgi:hypothetical protein
MCVSCACNKLNDDHGDSRDITMNQLHQAAAAAGVTPRDVAENIRRSVQQGG